MKRLRVAAGALSLLLTTLAAAQPLPRADSPEVVGLSSKRLQRLTDAFAADVKDGSIPGAVVLVLRHGKVAYLQTFGYRDRATQSAMQRDSIFRIASMTKPITMVAALMLAEEGKLQLMDPASRYIPQFNQLQVGVERLDSSGERTLLLESSRLEITVQDLMRHTSGMTYGIFGDSLVQRAYRTANTMDDQQTNAELMDKLSKLPLAYQPGSTFEYSMSNDVVGRIVEIASGMDLNRYVEERIAQPLHMSATTFVLDSREVPRLAQPQPGPDGAAHALPLTAQPNGSRAVVA